MKTILLLNAFLILWPLGSVAAEVDFSKVDAQIQQWVDEKDYPGAGLLIIGKDGKTLHEHYWNGYTRETTVMIASASKWLEAATLMTLVDQGKMDLDKPISTYLPEMSNSPAGENTLRQMFAHTSSLNHIQIDDHLGIDTFPAQLAAGHTDVKPGEMFSYGGTDLATGARAVEVVDGKPWLTVFGENIARPCQMKKTVTGHNLWTYSGIVGGDLYPCSDAADYINFLQMILNDGMFNGKRVLSTNAVQEMEADEIRGAFVKQPDYPEQTLGQKHKAMYGLGEWRLVLDDKGEAVVLSSPSFAGFFPWIDKKHGIAGVFVARGNGWPKIDTFRASAAIPKLVGEAAQPFVHPGNWHTQADIDRIRTNVAAGKEPWKSAWLAFKDSQAVVDYQPHVQAKVTDSYALQNDGQAAYCLAVKWMVSGDKQYAAAAIRIINAWTSEVKAIPNDTLRVGLGATKMANAAEILRYADGGAAGWSPEDVLRCEKFFKELVFPVIKQNGGGGWGTPCLSALVGIGVFCNDRDIYNLGCKMYLEDRGETDPGCGKSCLKEYVFANGQNGDSYRDQGHSQGALAHLGEVCETAWNQGDDLYGAYDNLLLKGYEYVARYNLGYDVEFIPYMDCHGNFKSSISSAGRGKFSPMYEMIYNHYVNRKGILAPYTKMVRDKYVPEVTNGDNAGIGTLTFTRDPFTSLKTTR